MVNTNSVKVLSIVRMTLERADKLIPSQVNFEAIKRELFASGDSDFRQHSKPTNKNFGWTLLSLANWIPSGSGRESEKALRRMARSRELFKAVDA